MSAAGGAAAAVAAIAQAISASGVLVKLEPGEFNQMLDLVRDPLIVCSQAGVFRTSYSYLTSYKGLAFYTRSKTPLPLPHDAEVVSARKVWMPA